MRTFRTELKKLYRDYYNNYLSVETFAEHHAVAYEDMEKIIEIGKLYHNNDADFNVETRKKGMSLFDIQTAIHNGYTVYWKSNNYGDSKGIKHLAYDSSKGACYYVSKYYDRNIDNDILDIIERGCTNEDTIYGNYLWKHNGGKVDWHLMPDLPGSSIEKDLDMFKKIFGVYSVTEPIKNYFKYHLKHPELQADQLKIYPCTTVDWTKIKEWYEDGSYKPYSENEEDLIKVIAYIKNNIFPWIRLNRIIRDIPNQNIIGGNSNVNLRQKLLAKEDISCDCIRCRQVKSNIDDVDKAELVIREYNSVNSIEFFISFESSDKSILYGFVRLRINQSNDDLIYNELKNCSFIRELHVYGDIINHNDKLNKSAQHIGFGKKLLQVAEEISISNKVYKIAVISGVGGREYYKKQGYYLYKNYMFKNLHNYYWIKPILIYICIIILILIVILLLKFKDLTINQLLPPIFKSKIVNETHLKKQAGKKIIYDRVDSFEKTKNSTIKKEGRWRH